MLLAYRDAVPAAQEVNGGRQLPDPDMAQAIAAAAEQRSAKRAIMNARWRVGRKLGRTLYAETGGDDRAADTVLGMLDSTELAEHIVTLHNTFWSRERDAQPDR